MTDLLQVEVDRSERYDSSFSLILTDIDQFKKINDEFSHSYGDQLLRVASDLLKKKSSVVRFNWSLGWK